MTYEIWLGDQLFAKTDWPPRAQAAWDRASRNRDAHVFGEYVTLLRGGKEIAGMQASTGTENPWPDGEAVNTRDVAKSIMTLARMLGFNDVDIAEAMTARGLPTTRSALRLAHTVSGTPRNVTPAELCVILDALTSLVAEDL